MSKIWQVLNDKNSVLVFDVDGVLASIEWGDYTHYGMSDEEWMSTYKNGAKFYKSDCVIKKMQDFIKDKDKERIYVITKVYVVEEFEDKRAFLNENYGILPDHVFYVFKNTEKVDYLNEIKEKYPEIEDKSVAMIDDNTDVLTDVMERTGYTTIHISSFLD